MAIEECETLVRWQFAVGTEALREECNTSAVSTTIPHGKGKGSVVPVHVMKVYRGLEI
jgi:hypothetical protein